MCLFLPDEGCLLNCLLKAPLKCDALSNATSLTDLPAMVSRCFSTSGIPDLKKGNSKLPNCSVRFRRICNNLMASVSKTCDPCLEACLVFFCPYKIEWLGESLRKIQFSFGLTLQLLLPLLLPSLPGAYHFPG